MYVVADDTVLYAEDGIPILIAVSAGGGSILCFGFISAFL